MVHVHTISEQELTYFNVATSGCKRQWSPTILLKTKWEWCERYVAPQKQLQYRFHGIGKVLDCLSQVWQVQCIIYYHTVFLWYEACNIQQILTLFWWLTFAPLLNRRSTISLAPLLAANVNGVQPFYTATWNKSQVRMPKICSDQCSCFRAHWEHLLRSHKLQSSSPFCASILPSPWNLQTLKPFCTM